MTSGRSGHTQHTYWILPAASCAAYFTGWCTCLQLRARLIHSVGILACSFVRGLFYWLVYLPAASCAAYPFGWYTCLQLRARPILSVGILASSFVRGLSDRFGILASSFVRGLFDIILQGVWVHRRFALFHLLYLGTPGERGRDPLQSTCLRREICSTAAFAAVYTDFSEGDASD